MDLGVINHEFRMIIRNDETGASSFHVAFYYVHFNSCDAQWRLASGPSRSVVSYLFLGVSNRHNRNHLPLGR